MLLKNSAFCKLQVLTKLIFRFIYQFSIFTLTEFSKQCPIFSYFSAVFEKSAITSRQELSFNEVLKECLISKDLQIIRKNVDLALSSVYCVEPLKILKR